jgi:hypothetical protein
MAVLGTSWHIRPSMRQFVLHIRALLLCVLLAACGSVADDERSLELELQPLNDSGVSGHVRLVEIDAALTRVEIEVDAAGHPSMPAHIHPGTCADLVPQPRYGLENVVDGLSTTEVPASFDDLTTSGEQAVNLHRSNQEMDVYTACVELP